MGYAWKTTWSALGALGVLVALGSSPGAAQGGGLECFTCDEACAREHGLSVGERVCTGPQGISGGFDEQPPAVAPGDGAQGPTAAATATTINRAEPPRFILGLVEWSFLPVVEVFRADGAVAAQDAEARIYADIESIFHCFHPGLRYPGGGSVDVDLRLAYNGVPVVVNGTTDGIMPGQARCILRRAWGYDFPRIAERADQDSRLGYRVTFEPRRRGVPDTDAARPQLLLERVAVADSAVQPAIAQALYEHLPSAERCAVIGLEDLPADLIVVEVAMQWRPGDEMLQPADVDIMVVNKTGTEMPSVDFLECLESTLAVWDLPALEGDHPRHEAAFFLTIRPPGWHGL